ncbi:CPBP family intramembrane metalloprotease [filamentous cyanobacterium CCP5]|nr:CPBP family intramembrane metalloprotease [filamentous cyanobacterium CCP5]
MAIFLGILGLTWLPIAAPFYWLANSGRLDLGGAIATGLLYLLFLGIWPWWGRHVHGLTYPWQALGITHYRGLATTHLGGFALGLTSVGLLILIQAVAGWAILKSPTVDPLRLVLEAVLVGTLVGLAEELLFRGWVLFELEQGYSASLALWGDSLLFAVVHFIKPLPAILATLPQFLGLLLLGMLLVWARRTPVPDNKINRVTTLGWPMGLHGGLVGGYYLVSVGSLAEVTGSVPAWVTGLQQNPLAGLLGLLLLGALAGLFRQTAQRQA